MKISRKVLVIVLSLLLVFNLPISAFAIMETDEQGNTSINQNVEDTCDYYSESRIIYKVLRENNPDLSDAEIEVIVADFIEKIRTIHQRIEAEKSSNGGDDSFTETSNIYYLGTVRNANGLSKSNYELHAIGPYDQIIPGDYITAPEMIDRVSDVKYTKTWFVSDAYTADVESVETLNVELRVEMDVGWTNSGGITKSDAIELGIEVQPSITVEAKIAYGTQLKADAWKIVALRPFIKYNVDTYVCTRGFHCYNTSTGAYYYMTDEVYGKDCYATEFGPKKWSRENVKHDMNAVVPSPPIEWEN